MKQYFETLWQQDLAMNDADRQRSELIRDLVPADVRTVLDVGCGSGDVLSVLATKFAVAGLELTDAGVAKTLARGLDCRQGSIDSIPFADKAFDLVMCSEVLEHLNEPILAKALVELARTTRRYVLITVPNRERLQAERRECPRCRSLSVPWTHIRSFNRVTLEHLLDDLGFEPIEVRAFGPPIPDRNRMFSRLLRWHWRLYNWLLPESVCPVCAYLVPGTPPHGLPTLGRLARQPKMEFAHLLDYLAMRLSCKQPRWLLGLYRRRSNAIVSQGQSAMGSAT